MAVKIDTTKTKSVNTSLSSLSTNVSNLSNYFTSTPSALSTLNSKVTSSLSNLSSNINEVDMLLGKYVLEVQTEDTKKNNELDNVILNKMIDENNLFIVVTTETFHSENTPNESDKSKKESNISNEEKSFIINKLKSSKVSSMIVINLLSGQEVHNEKNNNEIIKYIEENVLPIEKELASSMNEYELLDVMNGASIEVIKELKEIQKEFFSNKSLIFQATELWKNADSEFVSDNYYTCTSQMTDNEKIIWLSMQTTDNLKFLLDKGYISEEEYNKVNQNANNSSMVFAILTGKISFEESTLNKEAEGASDFSSWLTNSGYNLSAFIANLSSSDFKELVNNGDYSLLKECPQFLQRLINDGYEDEVNDLITSMNNDEFKKALDNDIIGLFKDLNDEDFEEKLYYLHKETDLTPYKEYLLISSLININKTATTNFIARLSNNYLNTMLEGRVINKELYDEVIKLKYPVDEVIDYFSTPRSALDTIDPHISEIINSEGFVNNMSDEQLSNLINSAFRGINDLYYIKGLSERVSNSNLSQDEKDAFYKTMYSGYNKKIVLEKIDLSKLSVPGTISFLLSMNNNQLNDVVVNNEVQKTLDNLSEEEREIYKNQLLTIYGPRYYFMSIPSKDGIYEAVIEVDGKQSAYYGRTREEIFNKVAMQYGGLLKRNINVISVNEVDSSQYNIVVAKKSATYVVSYIDKNGQTKETLLKSDENGIIDVKNFALPRDVNVNNIKPINTISTLGNDKVYNTEGYNNYGGNQSSAENLVTEYYNNKISSNSIEYKKCETIISQIKKYYPDATDEEIVNLADAYASVGCGYISMANNFINYMSTLENGEEIFKERFGFDLKVNNNETGEYSYNYETLSLDMFLTISNRDTIAKATNYPRTLYSTKSEYKKDNNTYFSKYGIQTDTIFVELDNKTPEEKSELIKSTIIDNPTYYYELSSNNFDLYSIENNTSNTNNSDLSLSNATITGEAILDIGGHGFSITDIDQDGNIIVSSWGDNFLYVPTEEEKFLDISGVRYTIN